MTVYASVALSSDGYMDDASPARLMLSTPGDWREVHRLRAACDAILVGANTVRRDNPSLTLRNAAQRSERCAEGMPAQPVKVTLSRSLQLDPRARFFTEGSGERFLFTTAEEGGGEFRATLIRRPEIDAALIVTELERRGINSLLVEGGAQTLRMFLREGLVDELRVAVNPAVRVDDPRAPRFDPVVDLAALHALHERVDGMEVATYVLHPDRRADDERLLREAITVSRQSPPCASCYRVGALVVTLRGERFTGYTHEGSPTHHAEQVAIDKALAAGADLRGAAIYTSMEPCTTRRSEPESCTELILRQGFGRVVFARYEPSHFAACEGALRLRRHGVEVRYLGRLAGEVNAINAHLADPA